MAKTCDCGFILEAFETDPRLACLPLAVRALWLVLVRRMQRLGGSVLAFGSEIPNLREIAMMVATDETELQTQIEQLLARGLLVRRDDGALASPLLAAREKRAETARINGLKGGRPRRGERPAGQGALLMPLPGGAAAGGEITQPKPTPRAVGSPAKLAEALSFEKEAQAGSAHAREAEARRIGALAVERAGLVGVPDAWVFGPVRNWLDAGATEAAILGVIDAAMARDVKPQPRGLGYFDAAVRDTIATAAVQAPSSEFAEDAESYIARCGAWERAGRPGAPPIRQRRAVA